MRPGRNSLGHFASQVDAVEPLVPRSHYATVGLVAPGAGVDAALLLGVPARVRRKAVPLPSPT